MSNMNQLEDAFPCITIRLATVAQDAPAWLAADLEAFMDQVKKNEKGQNWGYNPQIRASTLLSEASNVNHGPGRLLGRIGNDGAIQQVDRRHAKRRYDAQCVLELVAAVFEGEQEGVEWSSHNICRCGVALGCWSPGSIAVEVFLNRAQWERQYSAVDCIVASFICMASQFIV